MQLAVPVLKSEQVRRGEGERGDPKPRPEATMRLARMHAGSVRDLFGHAKWRARVDSR